MSEQSVDTSVYVHFPYCARKCPYCDFATRAITPADVPHVAYADAVLRELEGRSASLAGRRLSSVFFGGGTPSLWDAAELGRVLDAIRSAFSEQAPDLEITVECNPSSFDEAKAASLAEVGVNRVSIGIQSLDDTRLRFLGRLHDAEGALRALGHARKHFARVSGDLMFGMPGQDVAALEAEVRRLVDTGVEHVSAYSLTIEQGTVFGDLAKKGRLPLADEEEAAAMFVAVEPLFAELGFDRYEVSNFARPGAEARHNLHYWRQGAYLGLGAAAVGCLDTGVGSARRYRNEPDGDRYIAASAAEREESEEKLDPQTLLREALMLGLRTAEGIDLAAVERRAGIPLRTGREAALDRALANYEVIDTGTHLLVPRWRWLHLDSVVANLF